jgi:hypothetical protein
LLEHIVDCHTNRIPVNWYAKRPVNDFRRWGKSSSDPMLKGAARVLKHRQKYDWRMVLAGRFTCEAAIRERTRDARFQELAQEWKAETRFMSFAQQKFLVPSYQRIIGLGPSAIPMILRELQSSPDHWFWALAALTGENPVPADASGNFPAMTAAWLRWGRDQGYL